MFLFVEEMLLRAEARVPVVVVGSLSGSICMSLMPSTQASMVMAAVMCVQERSDLGQEEVPRMMRR